MIVVVPPQAAARVPVSNVSAENVPPNGISMWVWASIPPGSTYLPVASMTCVGLGATTPAPSGRPARGNTPAIFSSTTSTSASSVPDADTTVPFWIRMLTALSPGSLALAGGSWLYQRLVLVRAAVAVELPLVPDLGQLLHVEVADHDLVGVVSSRVAYQLAARVDEVGL